MTDLFNTGTRVHGTGGAGSVLRYEHGNVQVAWDNGLATWHRADALTVEPDGCGIPNRANWYVHVTWSVPVDGGTETGYTDVYACDAHMPADLAEATGTWDTSQLSAYPYVRGAAASLLQWDGHEQADILSVKVSHLR